MAKVLDYVHAKKYKWEDKAYEKFKKERTSNPDATYYPKGELVIVRDYLTGSKELKLAWKFTISSLIPFNEQWIYIDAISGEVIGDTPLLLDANTTGSAETLFSGTIGITCDSYSGGYRLNETRASTLNHSVNIHTWNCLSQPNLPNAIEFSNNNTNWTTGSWPAISQDQAALDAHWAEERVLDYWSTIHTRNSLDNQGLPIIGYVHFFEANSPAGWPNNAAWDPTDHIMLYGDGDDGVHFYPLVALDVVAHEMGHGVAQYTANFHSGDNHQECDALNEGFSDIWGACVEDWATSNKQTWLMGEEIVNALFTCLRNLQNPNDISALEGQHPDTYHGDFWDFNGESHNNSTVLSHWFYLLSEGGSGTNDFGDCFNVTAIGIDDAQLIAFGGEMMLNSSATYSDARNMTIQAAINLFGSNSNQVAQTTNAWYAVGVGDEYQYSITGPSFVCTSNSTFTLHHRPPGATISWMRSKNLIYVSGQGTDNYTVRAYSNEDKSSAFVKATVTGSCGQTILQKTTWVGRPGLPVTTPDGDPAMEVIYGRSYLVRLIHPPGADPSTGSWSTNGGITITSGNTGSSIVFKVTGWDYGQWHVNTTNNCGISDSYTGAAYIPGWRFSMQPNPANDYVEIIAEKKEYGTKGIVSDTYEVEIVNILKSPVYKSTKTDQPLLRIDTKQFVNGTYFIHFTAGKQSVVKQLVINH